MRILVWHVHGGWMDGFARGGHDYLVPASGAPETAPHITRVADDALRETDVDVVVLQRLEEFDEAARLLGRVPGRDVPAVFVEHNTPRASAVEQRHPLADQREIPVVHVTHFNALAWDTGRAPTRIIEHGVPDPGELYTGELARIGVVVNEPVRRDRVVGADLLPRFAEAAPIDAYGIGVEGLPAALGLGDDLLRAGGDLPTRDLHRALARRRVYAHPFRWTSLGLSLIEAMSMGMPVVALATTEAPRAVPPEAGAISTDLDGLIAETVLLLDDPERARTRGRAAREAALRRYGLSRFHRAWDHLLADVVEAHAARTRRATPAPGGVPGARTKGTDR